MQNALGATSELIYAMRGTILKIDPGSAKNGDLKAGVQTLEMNLMSLVVTRDSIPIFAVDAQNGVVKHGPLDHFESARKNLKLG
jgi:phage tail tube protein FII